MSNWDSGEHAEWSLSIQQATEAYQQKFNQAVDTAAARGFDVVPGEIADYILRLGVETKGALVKVNGQIYQNALKSILKAEDVEQKVLLGLAKIDLALDNAALENDLITIEAENKYEIDAYKAQIARMKSDVERRQAVIIEEEAKVRDSIIAYKKMAIEAERIGLAAEVQLAYAKLDTAKLKLQIIPYLYQMIEAEQMVLAAEQEKLLHLQNVLYWEQQLAIAQEAMIPFIEAKAAAKLQLATAVTAEAADKEALERLGFDKLELKEQDEANKHNLRVAENSLDIAKNNYTRAAFDNQLAKEKAKELLTEYQTDVRKNVITLTALLKEAERHFKTDLQWFWKQWELMHDALLYRFMASLKDDELLVDIQNIIERAKDDCKTIRASAHTKEEVQSSDFKYQYISSGSG